MTQTSYNPYHHAQQLGIHLHWVPDLHVLGAYHQPTRTIFLRQGEPAYIERSTLAHEIVHAEHEDTPLDIASYGPRIERRCDRIAARRLVTPGELARVRNLSDDPGYLCAKLGVAPWVLETIRKEEPCDSPT